VSRRDFLRISGVSAFGLAVAACAAPGASAPAQEAAGEGAAPPSQDGVVLKIQANEENEKPTVDLFIQQNPDVTVEYFNVTGIDHEEVASKILSMVAAGQTLDLGYAATEAAQLYAGQGLSERLDDYVQAAEADLQEYFSDVHPTLVEAFMYEGGLYQLPFDFNAANMYYNTQLFADAGYEHPAPDWTKDQFYEIAQAITKKDASGQTETFGYAWTNRLWGSWMPWIFVNNGNILTEERAPGGEWLWDAFYADDAAAEGRGGGWRWLAPKANDPANVEALEFMVQLTEEGIAPAIELGGGQTLQGFFTGGKLGMTPAGGFWSGGLFNAGMPADQFDVQLFPAWQSQRHQFGTGANFIFTQSPNKDLGWEYVKFRVTPEAMAVHGVFNPVTLTTPARRSMANAERYAETGPAHWQVFYDTLDQHPDTAPIPAPPISNPMTTIFTTYTSRAMTGELTPQAALDGMQADLEDLFARQGQDMYQVQD
jgi:ABC-type glycerol-3-phosphate transport system substrate-binding protein